MMPLGRILAWLVGLRMVVRILSGTKSGLILRAVTALSSPFFVFLLVCVVLNYVVNIYHNLVNK
jgi:hypothetical protein